MLEAVASGVGAAASDCGAVSGTCEASPDEAPLIPPFESELAFEAVVPESALVRNVRAHEEATDAQDEGDGCDQCNDDDCRPLTTCDVFQCVHMHPLVCVVYARAIACCARRSPQIMQLLTNVPAISP